MERPYGKGKEGKDVRNVTQSLAHIFNQQALSKRPLLLRCCAKYLKTRLWGPGWEVGIIMSHQRRFSFEFQGITRKGHQYPRVETSENEGLWKIWLNVYSFHRSSPVHLEMLFFIMFLPDGKKKKDSSLYAFKLVFRPHDLAPTCFSYPPVSSALPSEQPSSRPGQFSFTPPTQTLGFDSSRYLKIIHPEISAPLLPFVSWDQNPKPALPLPTPETAPVFRAPCLLQWLCAHVVEGWRLLTASLDLWMPGTRPPHSTFPEVCMPLLTAVRF